VDEALVTALEAAIADAGALLVRVQKYTRGAGPAGAALGREALALGDSARRLHRTQRLDGDAAAQLLAEARALGERLRAFLGEIRADAVYRDAVAAHAAGDQPALTRLLPAVFAGLEPVTQWPDLFVPLVSVRRGRPRPVADLVADVVRVRDEGLEAEGDDLSPGADAELPAVVLSQDPPGDEPAALRFPGGSFPAPVHRLWATGEHLVYVRRLRAPFVVRLATAAADDEQRRLETSPAEDTRRRAELGRALTAAGIPVEDG